MPPSSTRAIPIQAGHVEKGDRLAVFNARRQAPRFVRVKRVARDIKGSDNVEVSLFLEDGTIHRVQARSEVQVAGV